jgi:large subunit ribosomal protein L19e
MNLRLQKRLASSLLKCGEGRVWIDPEKISETEEAITREDVRRLIAEGVIKAKRKKGVTHRKKKKKRGTGSIKGTMYARKPKKNRWMDRIRAIRKLLKKIRAGGLSKTIYRRLYYKSKGGFYRDRAHLKLLLEKEGIKIGTGTKVQGKAKKKA